MFSLFCLILTFFWLDNAIAGSSIFGTGRFKIPTNSTASLGFASGSGRLPSNSLSTGTTSHNIPLGTGSLSSSIVSTQSTQSASSTQVISSNNLSTTTSIQPTTIVSTFVGTGGSTFLSTVIVIPTTTATSGSLTTTASLHPTTIISTLTGTGGSTFLSTFVGIPTVSSSSTATGPPDFGPIVFTETKTVNGVTQLIPVISGGAITSAIPLPTTPATTINPTGAAAWASASALSIQIVGAYPLIAAWILNPKPPQATAAIAALDKTTPIAAELIENLGGDISGPGGTDGGGPCGNKRRRLAGRNILGDAFHDLSDAVRCIDDATNKISGDIKNSINDDETDVNDVVKTVTSELDQLKPEVDDLNDSDPDDDPTGSNSQPSSTATSGSSSSCSTITNTVSDCDAFCTLVSASPSASISCTTTCTTETATGCIPQTGTTVRTTATAASATATFYCGADNVECLDDTLTPPPGPVIPCTNCITDQYGFEEAAPPTTAVSGRSYGGDIAKRAFVTYQQNFDGSVTEFLYSELKQAKLVPHGRISQNGQIEGSPAAISFALAGRQVKVGVVNLYGCTSVIVMSKKGIWMSHFWEVPSFIQPKYTDSSRRTVNYKFNQKQFDTDVLSTLNNGCVFDQSPGSVEGLLCHTGANGWFNEANEPQVVIVTPREKVLNARPGVLQYQDQVDQISARLDVIFPYILLPTVVDYISLGPDGKVIDQTNPQGFTWPQGKALFRYDPGIAKGSEGQGCGTERNPNVEVWVEDRLSPVATKNWKVVNNKKRDGGDSCSLSVDTSSATIISSSIRPSSSATVITSIGGSSTTSTPTSSSTSSTFVTSTSTVMIPGQNGVPQCVYKIAADLGINAGCPGINYCDCGGTYVPLLTSTAATALTTNCNYPTQPSVANCPAPSTTAAAPTTAPPSTTVLPPTTTAAPTSTAPPPPAYQTGTCTLHIYEWANDWHSPATAQLTVYDNANTQLYYNEFEKFAWGSVETIPGADSLLPYDIAVNFTMETSVSKKIKKSRISRELEKVSERLVGPPPPPPRIASQWEKWLILIQAGPTSWGFQDTGPGLPWCHLGGWDNPSLFTSVTPNRKADCYWAC